MTYVLGLDLTHILDQAAVHEHVASAATPGDVGTGHPMFMNIAVQYLRPKLSAYAKDTLQKVICELVADTELDLEVDPVAVSMLRLV